MKEIGLVIWRTLMKRKWNSQILFLTLLFTLISSCSSLLPQQHDEKELLSEGETIEPPEAQSPESPETQIQQTRGNGSTR